MKNIKIFCFGFGQVAKNFINKLIIEKYNITLTTTYRSKSSKNFFKGIRYNNYLFDGERFDNISGALQKFTEEIIVELFFSKTSLV